MFKQQRIPFFLTVQHTALHSTGMFPREKLIIYSWKFSHRTFLKGEEEEKNLASICGRTQIVVRPDKTGGSMLGV